jgi:hypothetical protein
MSFRNLACVLAVALQLSAPLPPGVTEVRPPHKPYIIISLFPDYKNEQIPKDVGGPGIKGVPDGVTYIVDPAERERYRLRFGSDGFIYDASGNKFDTTKAVRIDEHGVKTFPKLAMFVMDHQGNFYASNFQRVGIFHHSSFVGGADVAAAGEFEVIGGRLQFINDRSGHYRGDLAFSQQAIDRLDQLLPRGTIEALRKKGKISIGLRGEPH